MDARDAETRLVQGAVSGMRWRLLQNSGLRHRDLLHPTINVYVLWKPGSAYLKVKGCFHIICWIIDKSHVPNQVKGKHCLRFLQFKSATITAWPLLPAPLLRKRLSRIKPQRAWRPHLLNFCWAFPACDPGLWKKCTHFQSLITACLPTPTLPGPTGSYIRRTGFSPQINLISSFRVPEITWVCAVLSQSTSIPALRSAPHFTFHSALSADPGRRQLPRKK